MRKFCFLAVAAAALALLGTDQANAGGRRTRYYSYGGTTVRQSTSQATPSSQPVPSNQAQAAPSNQAAQSNSVRRYSYAPSTQRATGSFTMGSAPYNYNYWRADRKIRGY